MDATDAKAGGDKPVLENLAAEIRVQGIDPVIGEALKGAARRDLAAWTDVVMAAARRYSDTLVDAARRGE